MARLHKHIGIAALVAALSAAVACDSRHGREKTSAAGIATVSCLPGDRGYLRARLRGAIDSDLDWRGAALQCEGGARPQGRGVRVSFLGPADARGLRLRVVFGLAAVPGAATSTMAATNVTVIAEGRDRIYSTQGEDKCAVESLVQQPLADGQARTRIYRVAARGYCIDPAATLDGSGRLYISRFDFAGIARFEDNELHEATPHP